MDLLLHNHFLCKFGFYRIELQREDGFWRDFECFNKLPFVCRKACNDAADNPSEAPSNLPTLTPFKTPTLGPAPTPTNSPTQSMSPTTLFPTVSPISLSTRSPSGNSTTWPTNSPFLAPEATKLEEAIALTARISILFALATVLSVVFILERYKTRKYRRDNFAIIW